MTFPKKNTRKLLHKNETYLWHLNQDWEIKNKWIVIAKEGFENGQLLMINPYHHDFIPNPKTIIQAIEFGLKNGWNPEKKAQELRLDFNEQGFLVLI